MKERIKQLCKKNGISMNKLEEVLGFGKGYISKLGTTTPNTTKIQAISDYFGVSVDYLLTGKEKEDEEPYYINSDAKDLAEFLFRNPEYKVLFDASRKVKKEDIEFVKQMIDRIRGDSDDTGC